MNAYRELILRDSVILAPRRRSWRARIRSWYRRKLIEWNGSFLVRYPVRCPDCDRRSWVRKLNDEQVPVATRFE